MDTKRQFQIQHREKHIKILIELLPSDKRKDLLRFFKEQFYNTTSKAFVYNRILYIETIPPVQDAESVANFLTYMIKTIDDEADKLSSVVKDTITYETFFNKNEVLYNYKNTAQYKLEKFFTNFSIGKWRVFYNEFTKRKELSCVIYFFEEQKEGAMDNFLKHNEKYDLGGKLHFVFIDHSKINKEAC